MSNHFPKANKAAQKIMEELKAKAGSSESALPMLTIERFEAACDAILSGMAWRELSEAKTVENYVKPPGGAPANISCIMVDSRIVFVNPAKFRPPHNRLDSVGIETYVRMKGWSGPVAVTVRKNPSMMAYIAERLRPYESEPLPGSRGETHRRILRIIDSVESPTDKSELRHAYFAGRKAALQNNVVVETFRKASGVDIAKLPPGAKAEDLLCMVGGGLSEAQKEVVRRFVLRLRKTSFLEAFGLRNDGTSVFMEFGAGVDLIRPDELSLLEQLADVPPNTDTKDMNNG